MTNKVALIIGVGPGISYSFAKELRSAGYTVALASRDLQKLKPLSESIGAHAYRVDVGSPQEIRQLFSAVDKDHGEPQVVLFNPSARVKGGIETLDAQLVEQALHTTAFGAFVTAQEAARRMIPNRSGALFFTGATASVKGFAGSAGFAMGKFAVRGLAQCLARELSPVGVHVAHFVIDGAVKSEPTSPSSDLCPMSADAIAKSYMAVLNQPSAAWSWELELRSKDESF